MEHWDGDTWFRTLASDLFLLKSHNLSQSFVSDSAADWLLKLKDKAIQRRRRAYGGILLVEVGGCNEHRR